MNWKEAKVVEYPKRVGVRKEYNRDPCIFQCANANPAGECKCSKCDGERHGSHFVTPMHVFRLVDRKLHDPTLTQEELEFWSDIVKAIEKFNRSSKRRS